VDPSLGSTFGTPDFAFESGLWFGLAKARDTITGFPLSPLFEQLDSLESLQHVAFGA
jgi:hypothetical protein